MMTLTPGADGSQAYFSKDNYYTKDQGIEASFWYGHGAPLLGLVPGKRVDADLYQALWRGEVEGRKLGRVVKGQTIHHPGWDLTFSAPKSFSILSEVYGVSELRGIHEKAVRKALDAAERLIDTRVRLDGRAMMLPTGNGVFACFTHDTSRNLDCQLHTHSFLLNMTHTPNGWRSIQTDRIFRSQVTHAMGLEYRTALAIYAKEAGFILTEHRDPRFFEIAGVPQEMIQAFSSRANDIQKWFADNNVPYAPALAKTIALITRKSKESIDRDELRAIWLELAAQYPFDMGDTRRRHHQPDLPRPDSRSVPLDETPTNGRGRTLAIDGDRGEVNPSGVPGSNAGHSGGAGGAQGALGGGVAVVGPAQPSDDAGRPPASPTEARSQQQARKILAHALAHLAEREMGFTTRELMETAMTFSLGNAFASDLTAEIDRMKHSGHLVRAKDHPDWMASKRHRGEYWTTPKMQRMERYLIEQLEAGKKIGRALVGPVSVERELVNTRLNPQQKAALVAALTSEDRFFLIQGDPGVGKTTALQEYRKILSVHGYDVIGMAPSYQAVGELSHSLQIPGMTVDRFIADPNSAKLGQPFRQQVWVVDEGSMPSTDRMVKLLDLAVERDARILLVGDHQQLEAVGSGRAFKQMQEAGIGMASVNAWVRPQTDFTKDVYRTVMAQDYAAAFDVLRQHNALHVEKHESIGIRNMANEWLAYDEERRKNSLIVAPTNEQCREINSYLRDQLKQRGEIGQHDTNFTAFRDKPLTNEEVRFAGSYKTGDVLRFSNEQLGLGERKRDFVLRHEYLKVEGINTGTNVLALRSMKDQRLVFLNPAVNGGNREGGIQVYQQEKIALATGDKIRWLDNKNTHGIKRNTELTVERLTSDWMRLKKADGSSIKVETNDYKNLHFMHDYAKTAYAVQGMTRKNVLAIMSSWRQNTTNARSFMVAVTRASHHVSLYVDDTKKVLKALGRSGSNTEALTEPLFERAITDAKSKTRSNRAMI